jgi:hypothetical protein
VSDQARQDCVLVDAALHAVGDRMAFLYGQPGGVPVQQAPDGSRYVQLNLAPRQYVILE